MKKKPRASAKPTKRATHNVSDALRAEDERLRDELRHADMKKFDRVLAKAIKPPRP